MYLCTDKGKNMTKINIRLMIPIFGNSNFAVCNVDQFHAKLEEALYFESRGMLAVIPDSLKRKIM